MDGCAEGCGGITLGPRVVYKYFWLTCLLSSRFPAFGISLGTLYWEKRVVTGSAVGEIAYFVNVDHMFIA